jgi:hypothetical protein
VRDTGPGISSTGQAKLFQEFQQAEFDHSEEEWHWAWPGDLETDHRDARRAHLGGVEPRSRLDLCIHASRHRRRAGEAGMSKRISVLEDHEER